MRNDKSNEMRGWTTGKVVIVSITAIIIVLMFSAVLMVQIVLNNNPNLLSILTAQNPELNQNTLMTVLLAKYTKGSLDGNGQIDGSFKGRFTTTTVRNSEKVNLSCIDAFDYQIVTIPQNPVGVFAANVLISERRFNDVGCDVLGKFTKPDTYEPPTNSGAVSTTLTIYNESYAVYRCPIYNCAMREVNTERVGEFIPESIDIRKVQAGMKSQIGGFRGE